VKIFNKITEWLRTLIDLLFGYDFFVSYAPGDGMYYPFGFSSVSNSVFSDATLSCSCLRAGVLTEDNQSRKLL
jgi:hypothetical protein